MIKRRALAIISLCCIQVLIGQVGIGTTSPDASAVMEVFSTESGFLMPRMTTAQRNTISNPATGLVLYNFDEGCLQINSGTPSAPNWECIGEGTPIVSNDCNLNGFEGIYVSGGSLAVSNKFSVIITNNSFSTANIGFAVNDLVLSGVGGVSVNSVSPTSATLIAGASQVVEYELTGTPSSDGVLTGVWTKLGLDCTKIVNVIKGNATFTLPQTAFVVSTYDVTPLVDIQGVVDNASNQLTVTIPYTSGVGTYDAYTGTYTLNNAGTGEGGDANSFRLSYSSGTFSASGSITATIELDGDGSFNAEKQLFGIQETIAALDFQVNGISKGNVNLDVIGGIPDRNFADTDHKFIYVPIVADDGNTWLNNNLGANYANANHAQFSPTQQATAYNDHHAYGSLFQWGRYSDGHELINYTNSTTGVSVNGFTSTNAITDTSGHNMFITENASPFDWRVPGNDNLWQGEAGINNPCPQGYRVPTETEFVTLVSAEGITNYTTAASSSLAFSTAGYRHYFSGTVSHEATICDLWTSSVAGTSARYRGIGSSYTNVSSYGRGGGFGVRCIKDY